MQFHIVRLDNGTGGATESYVNQINNFLNSHFNPHDIYINKVGIDYINNSSFFNMNDGNFYSLISTNNNANAINFYLTNSCSSWAGRAQSVPSKNLVLVKSLGLTGVAAHEFGHCLNLMHTFQGTESGSNGCQENIDGSNCNTCGDNVCDTPADANIGVSGGYSPDMTNDMSYYTPSTLDHFTTQQGLRMRNAIGGSPILQSTLGFQCASIIGTTNICATSNTQFTLYNPQNIPVVWSVSPNIQIIYSKNTGITISPINSTASGQGTITANINGFLISKTIWVGKPSIETQLISDSNYVNINLISANGIPISQQGITATTWTKIASTNGGNAGGSGFEGFGLGANMNWTATLKITATNVCGTTEIIRDITPAVPAPCGKVAYDVTSDTKKNYSARIIDPCARTAANSKVEDKDIKSAVVHDIYGNFIKEFKTNNFDFTDLNKGYYILNVLIKDNKLTKKLLID